MMTEGAQLRGPLGYRAVTGHACCRRLAPLPLLAALISWCQQDLGEARCITAHAGVILADARCMNPTLNRESPAL